MIRLHGLFGGLLLVLSAWANSSVAQHSQRIDSVSNALQQPQTTAVRLKLNEKLAQLWLKSNQVEPALRLIDSTLAVLATQRPPANPATRRTWEVLRVTALVAANRFQEALAESRTLPNELKQSNQLADWAVLASRLSVAYYQMGQIDSARLVAADARRLFALLQQPVEWADVRMQEGVFFAEQGEFKPALRAMLDADSIYRHHQKPDRRGQLLLNISQLQHIAGEPKASNQNLQRAYQLLDSCRCNEQTLVIVLQNMAAGKAETGQFSDALALFNRALSISIDHQQHYARVVIHSSLAKIHQQLQQLDSAQVHLSASLKLARQTDQPRVYHEVLVGQASIHLMQGRYDEALANLKPAEVWFTEQNQQTNLLEIYLLRHQVDSLRGDFKSAYTYLKRYMLLRNQRDDADQARELGRLQAEYEGNRRLDLQRQQQAAERTRSNWLIGSISGGLLAALLLAYLMYRSRRRARRVNRLLRKLNHETIQQKTEIESQNAEIQAMNHQLGITLSEAEQQRDHLADQHRRIRDSIQYASRIQAGMLPSTETVHAQFAASALFFLPYEAVSGDFYWLARVAGRLLWAVADCTGHGVPGAFMSLIAKSQLDRLAEAHANDPAALLEALDAAVRQSLQQHERSDRLDGLDLGLCAWDPQAQVVEFAGANRPLWVVRGETLLEYPPTGRALGGQPTRQIRPFTLHRHAWQAGDRFLLFSDGISDQFGPFDSQRNRALKFGVQRFKDFWLSQHHIPLPATAEHFAQQFGTWMHGQRQLDDCTWWCVELIDPFGSA